MTLIYKVKGQGHIANATYIQYLANGCMEYILTCRPSPYRSNQPWKKCNYDLKVQRSSSLCKYT